MNLPEKYKGATPGPWGVRDAPGAKVYAIYGSEIGRTEGSALAETYRQGRENPAANARLIADAPLLACRVAELEEAFSWQKIDTAPREQWILVWDKRHEQCMTWIENKKGTEFLFPFGGSPVMPFKPTHWMPLPPPPSVAANDNAPCGSTESPACAENDNAHAAEDAA